MKPADWFAIDGVFPAVKCEICETFYPAGSEDYVAFHGHVTLGLEQMLVPVDPPAKPKKRTIRVVCREPSCVLSLVKRMLNVDVEGQPELWFQVMQGWAKNAGFTLTNPKAKAPAKVKAKKKLADKAPR